MCLVSHVLEAPRPTGPAHPLMFTICLSGKVRHCDILLVIIEGAAP